MQIMIQANMDPNEERDTMMMKADFAAATLSTAANDSRPRRRPSTARCEHQRQRQKVEEDQSQHGRAECPRHGNLAGPARWMAKPLPRNNLVPMAPPMAIMLMRRALR